MSSGDFVRCLVGPVGSGKSSGCCVEILRRAMEQGRGPDGLRHTRCVVIRNTYGELRTTTRKTFEQWVPDALCKWHEAQFTCDIAFNDVRCEVMFLALDRPDHVKKLLSLELTFAYINEAKEIPRAVFDMIQTRLGRYPAKKDGGATWFGLWMDSNPPDTDHWIYRVFEEAKPEGHSIFRQPDGLSLEAENLENLPGGRGYYTRICIGKGEDFINVYVRGRYGFVKEGKPVFPTYNDAMHCKAVVPNVKGAILLGMDFGLTPAAVLAQRAGGSGQLQVFDEFVSEDLGAVNFARLLRQKIASEYPGRSVRGWGDPAGEGRSQVDERTPFDVVKEAGLPVDPAPTNDPRRRQEAVSGLLGRLTLTGEPAIIIDPKCRVLRKGFLGGYARRRVAVSGEDRFKDEPDKNQFSHVADALQYLCVGEGEDDKAITGATRRKVQVRVKVHRAVRGY
jgi:hypothetical protein